MCCGDLGVLVFYYWCLLVYVVRFGYWLRCGFFGEYGLSLRCSGVGSQVVCGEVFSGVGGVILVSCASFVKL